MKLPFSAALLTSALMFPALTHAADAAPLVDTLKAFTQCDAGFFGSLHTHSKTWQAYAPLTLDRGYAWIAVKDRTDRSANSVPVTAPPIAGLKLLSYVDESTDLGTLGHYYYWGFIVEGGVDEVASKIAPLMAQPASLQKGDGVYARSELKVGDHWQANTPQPGTAPGVARVERVLVVEPEGKQGTQSRVSCSVQGGINSALLARLRPDITPADYPRFAGFTDIADVDVPPSVLQRLDSPMLQPKFKTLTYTYLSKKNDGSQDRPVSVTLIADGGLLKKKEVYSERFSVDRLMQADLIQLKAKMNGVGDGRVLQTREAELHMPTSWSPGQTFSSHLSMADVPAKPRDKKIETNMRCQVGERIPARQVFAELPGDAIKLDCADDDYKTSRVFIEDLGVSLTLESSSGSTRYVYELTGLDVVR